MKTILNWMFFKNTWLWFHVLAGVFICAMLSPLLYLILAFLWEIYEFMSDDIPAIYGCYERFFFDAIADIYFPLIVFSISNI